MEFSKFTSLEHADKSRVISQVEKLNYTGEWIVTEKVDGANFSFYYDGGDIKVASRNQFVTSSFFSCSEVIEKYEDKVKEVYNRFKMPIKITGELYGKGIQNRIEYGGKDFVAFDLEVDGKPIPWSWMELVLEDAGIPTTKLIGIFDSLEEALEVSPDFVSHYTPDNFEVGGGGKENKAEGVTIQPNTPMFFNSGSRVWLKRVSSEFKELSKRKSPPPPKEIEDGFVKEVLNYLLNCVNNNRIMSAISKHGEVTSKDFGILMKAVVEDILEEYSKDFGKHPKDVCGDYWGIVSKNFNASVVREVRKEFVKHI